MKWIPHAVVAFLLVGLGAWAGSCVAGGDVTTVVRNVPDTVLVDNPVLERMVEELELEAEGLRARLEGRRTVEPRTIVRTDTFLAECPAVTFTAARMDDGGILDVGQLTQVEGGYRTELRQGIDLSRCDEGFSISEEGVVCDPARLGHLELYGGVEAWLGDQAGRVNGEAGLAWRPAYRSTFRLELAGSTARGGALVLRARKGLRLF